MHAAPFAFVRRGGRFRDRSHRRPISFMNELPSFFRWHHRPRRQSNDGTKLWRELGALLFKVSLEDTNAADFHCRRSSSSERRKSCSSRLFVLVPAVNSFMQCTVSGLLNERAVSSVSVPRLGRFSPSEMQRCPRRTSATTRVSGMPIQG